MDSPQTLLLSLLLIPLVGAVVIACFLRRLGSIAAGVSVLSAGAMAVVTFILLKEFNGEPWAHSWEWLRLGDFAINIGYLFNTQAALMLAVVAFVGFLIHVFSLGYMHDDSAKARFFGGLTLFMFSMAGIVLSDNLIMLFIFWELVGFSSYMLIAHYWKTADAANASKKAFITNRVGDFGFLIGIVWTYHYYGTVNLTELASVVDVQGTVVGLSLLLSCGFLGKSAQFPLHVWLPDAMAGPTPISALIHAATMVAAGIYFIARIFFLFPPEALQVLLWLSVVMTAYAGFCALAQTDIKKILAYSTLSQLGYMGVALGLGYPGLAIFHMACHAFFKALLFLGSGSVIHACHHEQDIFKMGGLYKKMPITTITFAIGVLALCGVYGLSGFYSKDAIIEAAYLDDKAIFYIVMFSALMTSIYMGRLFWIAFFGKAKSENAEHAKESPFVMLLPLILLAGLSIVGGYESLWPHAVAESFASELHHVHDGIKEAGAKTLMLGIGSAAWIIGLVGSLFFYGAGATKDRLQESFSPVYALCKSKLFIDELYGFYVKSIQNRIADILHVFDLVFIGGLIVRGTAGLAGLCGIGFRALHVGSAQAYVFWFLLGVIIFGVVAFN